MARRGAAIYASFRASRALPRRSSRHNLCCRERWAACIGKSLLRRDFLRHGARDPFDHRTPAHVYCGENGRWHDKGGGPFGVQFALWRLTRVAQDAMRPAAGEACCAQAGKPMLTEIENIGEEPMRHLLLAAIGLVVVSALAVTFPSAASAQAQVALTGVVSSSEEPAMEGVLVSATKAGSNGRPLQFSCEPARAGAIHPCRARGRL
jgi:hypothetical protein